jgi:glutathione S-transferase
MTRVTWMLEELGEPYEIQKIRLGSDELKSLNPSGKGPVLIDEAISCCRIRRRSACISQTNMATRVSDLRDARERAHDGELDVLRALGTGGALWNKLKHRLLLPEELRADVIPWVTAEFARECATLEKRLGSNDYAMGDRFTCVDIVLGHCGQWGRSGKLESGSEVVDAYFDRVLARPAYQRAMERETLAKTAA